MAKRTSARVATYRSASFGGSLVSAEEWCGAVKGSKTSDKRSVAMMSKRRAAFVDASTRTADPSLAQARVSDLRDSDFGALHTSYSTTRLHSRAAKARNQRRVVSRMAKANARLYGAAIVHENTSFVRPMWTNRQREGMGFTVTPRLAARR